MEDRSTSVHIVLEAGAVPESSSWTATLWGWMASCPSVFPAASIPVGHMVPSHMLLSAVLTAPHMGMLTLTRLEETLH